MIAELSLPLRERDGREIGNLTIACLRGRERWRDIDALVDFRNTPDDVYPAAPVQLLEETSYAYAVASTAGRQVDGLEPSDVFTSTRDAAHGRLDAQRATGTMTITVFFSDGTSGQCDVEIRSRKLNYETEYRSMLLRIAREAA